MARDLLCALDPVEFARLVGFEADPWQADVLRSESRRMLLNCSRQSGKSHTTAILVAHRALYNANRLILLVSPAERQSKELFLKVREIFSAVGAREQMAEDNKLSCILENKSRIVSLPSSEKTIRGFSAVDLLVIDEASRVDDSLYIAVRPMLAVSKGRLLALSTPFGKRGWWYEAWENGGDEWVRVRVDATQCPRFSSEFLASERRSMGEWWYDQEYLTQFRETVDQVFPYELVRKAEDDSVVPLAL